MGGDGVMAKVQSVTTGADQALVVTLHSSAGVARTGAGPVDFSVTVGAHFSMAEGIAEAAVRAMDVLLAHKWGKTEAE